MRRIIQTHKSPEIHQDYRATWRDSNPEFEYHFFNDTAQREFIIEYMPEVIEAYDRLPMAVQKADLFRYVAVYQLGGLYADVDTKCEAPLCSYLDLDKINIGVLYNDTNLVQWVFYSPPKQKEFKVLIETVKARIDARTDNDLIKTMKNLGTIDLTGPGVFDYIMLRQKNVAYLPRDFWGLTTKETSINLKARHLFDQSWCGNHNTLN